jgi:hypothetical protein
VLPSQSNRQEDPCNSRPQTPSKAPFPLSLI